MHNIRSDYVNNEVDFFEEAAVEERGQGSGIMILGYERRDGRKGIRNYILVAYLVECAHHVARAIATPFEDDGAQLIGFPGCYPNAYAQRMMEAFCTHPNVGAVAGGLARVRAVQPAAADGDHPRLRPAVRAGGDPEDRRHACDDPGRTRMGARGARRDRHGAPRADRSRRPDRRDRVRRLGRDQRAHRQPGDRDRLRSRIDAGGTAIFEELGELFGCEEHMAARALTPALGEEIRKAMAKATRHYAALDQSSFGGGNITGGLSTIEEKSIGAYAKSGTKPIAGMLRPGVLPPRPGLYLMDMVPDGETKWGFANINDNATIVEQIACGAHIVLFSTGRGSVVGSAISPVIKICANPETYRRLADDMDVDAGRILEGRGTLAEVGAEVFDADPEGRRGRADQLRGARAPGVHPRLQVVRAARALLPASMTRSGAGNSGRVLR